MLVIAIQILNSIIPTTPSPSAPPLLEKEGREQRKTYYPAAAALAFANHPVAAACPGQ
jgi:hypothetical protein